MKKKAGVLAFKTDKLFNTVFLVEYPFEKDFNKLDLPKGNIEEGETPLQAAIRELKEETGIEACPEELSFAAHELIEDAKIEVWWYYLDLDHYDVKLKDLKTENSPESIFGYDWRTEEQLYEADFQEWVLQSLPDLDAVPTADCQVIIC
jgi:8-oxo-dGTP pyrophosphatase MutT (NUDIX family)